ncbi:DNA-binding response regulator [Aliidiomarina sedimenti]|uniref:DNA-binding response regulator n=1 Tax=Aliidiomarina sedimenti TaxID=1933879 RepID=A0ABY0BXQ6_9GAMM|nr:response regulator transcription factor [Aliidiomarina sedimenti]RUO28972.1 DNA-binding response regulator [Aliidiomarina sedimenti]
MHILLVEDDQQVANAIRRGLELHDFAVDQVTGLAQARAALQHFSSDLVVLDLGLRDGNGMTLLAQWRAEQQQIPVIILTARDALADRVAGLQAGADDYVTKPFELDELIARIHALLRRSSGRASPMIRHGALEFEPGLRELRYHGEVVCLPRRELLLMEKFLYAGRRVLSADQLNDSLYGYGEEPDSNALNVHIYHLRKKLGKNVIETIRGLGFRLGKAE